LEHHETSAPVIRRVLEGWVAALTRPGIGTFSDLIAGASWSGVLVSLLIGGVVAGLVRGAASGGTGQGPVEAFITGLVGNWVLFCIGAAYLLVVTRLLSNPEGQRAQVYAASLFWPLLLVPANLLGAVGMVGAAGILLWFAALLYGLYLTYLVVQAVPGLSTRGARFVVLIPLIVLLILGLLTFGLLTLLENNLNTIDNP
jgi:hypothetical protein